MTQVNVLPYSSPKGDFVSGRSLALAASIALLLCALFQLLGIGSTWLEIHLLEQAAAGQAITPAVANANDQRQMMVGLAQLGIYLVCIVLFIMWLRRAYKNLRSLGARGLKYSPGWAIGAWFIPFLNLVRPYQVVKETWQGSDPDSDVSRGVDRAPGAAIIGWWWGIWLLSNFAGNAASRVGRADSIDSMIAADWADIVASGLTVVAALLVVQIIRAIDRRQEVKSTRLTEGEMRAAGISLGPPPF